MPSVRETAVAVGAYSTATNPSVVITKPGGVIAGDTLLAFLVVAAETGNANGVVINEPGGWTEIHRSEGSFVALVHAIYKKVAGGAEGTNYTWTINNPIPGTLSCAIGGVNYGLFGNVYSVTPGTKNESPGGNSATVIDFDSVNRLSADALVIAFASAIRQSTLGVSITPPGGYTERKDSSRAGSTASYCVEASEQLYTPPGSTGNLTGAASNAGDNFGILTVVESYAPGGGWGNPIF